MINWISLPLDIWTVILCLNTWDIDIYRAELTCKTFRDASRRRLKLLFYELSWSTVSLYHNLRRADGLILDACEDIFKSNLRHLTISTDVHFKHRRENTDNEDDWLLIKPANNLILQWLVKYPKTEVKVHTNLLNEEGMHEFDRQLMYVWTPTQLTIKFVNPLIAEVINVYRSTYGDNAFVLIDAGAFWPAIYDGLIDLIKPYFINELRIENTIATDMDPLWNNLEAMNIDKLVIHIASYSGMDWIPFWNDLWPNGPPCQFETRYQDPLWHEFLGLTNKEIKEPEGTDE